MKYSGELSRNIRKIRYDLNLLIEKSFIQRYEVASKPSDETHSVRSGLTRQLLFFLGFFLLFIVGLSMAPVLLHSDLAYQFISPQQLPWALLGFILLYFYLVVKLFYFLFS
jgi:hypothetical protein